MLNIAENIRNALDDRNIGCVIFVDLQKTFGTVDHEILSHYGIRGVSNDWFKSYLSNHNQYLSIDGQGSGLAAVNCGVSRGTFLEHILFLLYIYNLK